MTTAENDHVCIKPSGHLRATVDTLVSESFAGRTLDQSRFDRLLPPPDPGAHGLIAYGCCRSECGVARVAICGTETPSTGSWVESRRRGSTSPTAKIRSQARPSAYSTSCLRRSHVRGHRGTSMPSPRSNRADESHQTSVLLRRGRLCRIWSLWNAITVSLWGFMSSRLTYSSYSARWFLISMNLLIPAFTNGERASRYSSTSLLRGWNEQTYLAPRMRHGSMTSSDDVP